MVIAVTIVGMMQMTGDDVVDVIAMRHGFMAAVLAVHVARFVSSAAVIRRTVCGVIAVDVEAMLVVVTIVGVMQVTVVQIIDVVVVLDSRVAAVAAVFVVVA